MSAFAIYPRSAPRAPGMCAVLVSEPATPREAQLLRDHPGEPLWRVTLWRSDGGVFVSSTAGPQPELHDALLHHSVCEDAWAEIVRP